MASSEAEPLTKARASEPSATVSLCCVESSRLARVPLIGTICRKKRPEDQVITSRQSGLHVSHFVCAHNIALTFNISTILLSIMIVYY